MYSGTYYMACSMSVRYYVKDGKSFNVPCTVWLGSRGMGVVFSSAGDCCKNISSRPWVILMDRSGFGSGKWYVG